jgi:AAA+ superfamily predicted ATPase
MIRTTTPKRQPARHAIGRVVDSYVHSIEPNRGSFTQFGGLPGLTLPCPFLPGLTLPRPLIPAPEPVVAQIRKVSVKRHVKSIGDLVRMVDDNPLSDDVEYDIAMDKLHAASEPLRQLDAMVGLNTLKSAVCDQVIYYLQGLHEGSENDYMHTVIEGPPGTGKTEVAKLLGGVFSKLGILKKKTFKKATRADMVAGYLGQTTIKTKALIEECLGGVLFIDEAYSLGNDEKKDSYSKECLDTLCEALSDHKGELMVIIAGYSDQLDSCFFKYNDGLRSRFAWRFTTDVYSADELFAILSKKTSEAGWTLSSGIESGWFTSKVDALEYAGRDVETVFAKSKIAHSRRLFMDNTVIRKELSSEDLDAGYDAYKENYSSEAETTFLPSMYM